MSNPTLPCAASLNDELIVTGQAASNQGIHHAGPSTYQDGNLDIMPRSGKDLRSSIDLTLQAFG